MNIRKKIYIGLLIWISAGFLSATVMQVIAPNKGVMQSIHKGKYAPGTLTRHTDNQAWDIVNENFAYVNANLGSGTGIDTTVFQLDSITYELKDGAVHAIFYKDGDTIPPYYPYDSRDPGAFVFNTQSGTTYTPILSDNGKVLNMTNVGVDTIQLPTHASVAFVTYIPIHIRNMAGGTTLVRPPAGGSMSGDSIVSATKWATVVKISATEWDLFGGTE